MEFQNLQSKETEQALKDHEIQRFQDQYTVFGHFEPPHYFVFAEDKNRKLIMSENYVSKSQLIEGDELILRKSGSQQYYKMVNPAPRTSLNCFVQKYKGDTFAVTGQRSWKIMQSTVIFHTLKQGDLVNIIIPQAESEYCAFDSIVLSE